MFLAAGVIAESIGHDRIADLGGMGRAMPLTVFAFGLGGLSLMGLPPSGGFAAKWLLLNGGGRKWSMAVGGGDAGRRAARRWLHLPRLAPALAGGIVPLKAPAQRTARPSP